MNDQTGISKGAVDLSDHQKTGIETLRRFAEQIAEGSLIDFVFLGLRPNGDFLPDSVVTNKFNAVILLGGLQVLNVDLVDAVKAPADGPVMSTLPPKTDQPLAVAPAGSDAG